MEKLRLILCDEDKRYINALGEYMTHHAILFKVVVFSDVELFKRHLKEESDFDILLINEEIIHLLQNRSPITILLSETMPTDDANEEGIYKVYKYRPASKVIQEIKYIYGKASEESLPVEIGKGAKLIGFFSPAGGCGTSSVTVAVSRFISMRDKKVLYLNFEDIPSSKSFFDLNEEKRNLSDFLYYLFIKEESNITSLIKSFMFTDQWRVDCFYPQSNYMDLLQLTYEEIRYLLEVLCSKTDYEYICIDFSSTIHERNFPLSLCSKTFIIISDSEPSKLKYKIYAQGCTGDQASFLTTSALVFNYCDDVQKAPFTIENDPSSFHEEANFLHISLEGKFGKGAKRIADNILSW